MPNNILINFRGGIGDFLMLTPLLKSLFRHPGNKIYVLAPREAKYILDKYDYFAERRYINYQEKRGKKIASLFNIQKLYRGKIDIMITPICTQGFFSSLVSLVVAPKISLCFYRSILDAVIRPIIIEPNLYESSIIQNIKVLKHLKISPTTVETEIPIVQDNETNANIFLRSNAIKDDDLKVCVAPYTGGMHGYPRKEWAITNFMELSVKLNKLYNAKILMLGNEQELKKIRRYSYAFGNGAIITQPEYFNIFDAAALMKRAQVLICNDGGLMHIGAAVKIPIVSIWGPTPHGINGYSGRDNFHVIRNNNCLPCRYSGIKKNCTNQVCLNIAIDKVFQVCQKIIDKTVK